LWHGVRCVGVAILTWSMLLQVQGLMSDLREKERKRALRLEREAEGEEEDQAESEERVASAVPDERQDDDEGEEAML
jgi:hypothetical protein